jgi:uncharacterized membrane protein HdeD (DUF308 family)
MTSANITANVHATTHRADESYVEAWWFVGISIVFLIGGLAAMVLPMLARVPVTLNLGWLFAIIGLSQLLHGALDRNWEGVLWQAIIGAVFLIAGCALLLEPRLETPLLTVLIGIVLAATGTLQILFGTTFRPYAGWAWMVAAGVVAIGAAGFIVLSWPSPADWVKSVELGITVMFTGWCYLLMAGAAQHVGDEATKAKASQ